MSETRTNHDDVHVPGARRKLPRSRGVGSGLLILLLGAWGALIPFIGPYFNFSYTPDKAWHWDAARGWLEVLPGAVAALGGLLLLLSSSRAATLLGAWLGIAGGAWFVVGLPLAPLLHIGSPGTPAGSHRSVTTLETLFLFYALGALIIFLAATAFGRLSVVSLRDVNAAERRHEAAVAEREAEEREAAERAVAERERVHRADLERDAADRAAARRGAGTDAARTDHGAGATAAGADSREQAPAQQGAAQQAPAQQAPAQQAPAQQAPAQQAPAQQAPAQQAPAQQAPAQQAQGAGYDPQAPGGTRAYDPNAPQATQGFDPNQPPQR